jgi:hypothetical protein
MIHVLSNLTSGYELQLDKTLAVEEIRAELSIRFERLSTRYTNNNEG